MSHSKLFFFFFEGENFLHFCLLREIKISLLSAFKEEHFTRWDIIEREKRGAKQRDR
tara:strand:+ start:101 stop:271 length:171 start_codon:yes stop_codon:yes gene_type:complete